MFDMIAGKGYKITTKNLLCHELLGLEAKVAESSDASREGTLGKVVKETKNTFVLETKEGEKVLPKKECVFEFVLGKQKALVDGKKICLRPEERLKEFWRKCA